MKDQSRKKGFYKKKKERQKGERQKQREKPFILSSGVTLALDSASLTGRYTGGFFFIFRYYQQGELFSEKEKKRARRIVPLLGYIV